MSGPPRGGLEQTLVRAAGDAAFRARLLADRSRAAQQAGIALSDAERAILDSVPATELDGMIAGLPPVLPEPITPPPVFMPPMGIRPDEPGIVRGHSSRVALIALGTAVAAGAAIGVALCTTGHTAKVPPPRTEVPAPPAPRDRPDAGSIDGDKGPGPKR